MVNTQPPEVAQQPLQEPAVVNAPHEDEERVRQKQAAKEAVKLEEEYKKFIK